MKQFLLILCLATLVTGIGITSSGGGYSQHAKADFLSGNTTNTRIGGGEQPAAAWNNSHLDDQQQAFVLCGRFGVLTAIGCAGVLATPTPSPTVEPFACTQLCSSEEWLWFLYDRATELGTRLLEIIPGFKR